MFEITAGALLPFKVLSSFSATLSNFRPRYEKNTPTECVGSMKRKRAPVKMEDFSKTLAQAAEFIPGRLYFVSLNIDNPPNSSSVHYFTVDTEECYDNFYDDFGPLNLSVLYHYCDTLDWKLSKQNTNLHNKKIVHYSGTSEKDRVNAAFLIGAYAVINLDFDPEHAYEVLAKCSKKNFIEFRDASIGDPYTLSLLDCLKAVKKALEYGFFNFNNFDDFEYEHYERVENGDMNWIVPEKFIAFCGPHHYSDRLNGFHSPETYFSYFRRHNVTTVIRLNRKAYDSNEFTQAGFEHKDLFFIDGGIPNDRILNKFLSVCENSKGAVAVHCKAGLGRTGTLIACYIMKHYKFTAAEAIAWIRICRPGSIIAHQQTWLLQKQKQMWAAGEEYRQKLRVNGPVKHKVGIYGIRAVNNNKNKANDNVTGIMKKVDSMEINDKEEYFDSEENKVTQGDRLNEIKAQRRSKSKQPVLTSLTDRKGFRSKVIVNTTTSSVRVGRIITNTTKSTTSSTRVLSKRNEMNETQTARRCSQRKINASLNKVPETKKKENLSWLIKNGTTSTEKLETIKRCKRTLALERDKTTPHVKVLRRSHGQSSKSDGKLHLPSVKINKSI